MSSSSAIGDKLPTPGPSPPLSSHSGSPRLGTGSSESPTTTIHHTGGQQFAHHYDFSGSNPLPLIDQQPLPSGISASSGAPVVQWGSWADPRPQQLPQFQQMYYKPAYHPEIHYSAYEHPIKTEYNAFEDHQEFMMQQFLPQNQSYMPPPSEDISQTPSFSTDPHPVQTFPNNGHQGTPPFIPTTESSAFEKNESFTKSWSQQSSLKNLPGDDLQDMSDFLEFQPAQPSQEPQTTSEGYFWTNEGGDSSIPQDLGGTEYADDFTENLTEL